MIVIHTRTINTVQMTEQFYSRRHVDYHLAERIVFFRLDPRSTHVLCESNIDFSSVNAYQTIETGKKRASFDDDGTDEDDHGVTLVDRRKRRWKSRERKRSISISIEGFASSHGHEEIRSTRLMTRTMQMRKSLLASLSRQNRTLRMVIKEDRVSL
jgi:hypothetical protein